MNLDRIYRLLPTYAQLADEIEGSLALRKISRTINGPLEGIDKALTSTQYLLDPNTLPPRFLDWYQQILGWSPIDSQWVGLGLNPRWPVQYKRKILLQAWDYNLSKGTDRSIYLAYAIWLVLDQATIASKLKIYRPFDLKPTAYLSGWWDYSTRLDANSLLLLQDWQQVGSGDYIGNRALSNARFLTGTPVSSWTDTDTEELMAYRRLITTEPSGLGPKRPKLHLDLESSEWNNAFPNALTLNAEVFETATLPTLYGHRKFSLRDLGSNSTNLTLDAVSTPIETISESITVDGMLFNDLWLAPCGSGFPADCQYSPLLTTREILTYERTIIPIYITTAYPGMNAILGGKIRLLLEVDRDEMNDTGLYFVPPSNIFWATSEAEDSLRSLYFDPVEYSCLWTEFVFQFEVNCIVNHIAIALDDRVYTIEKDLSHSYPVGSCFCWRVTLPIKLGEIPDPLLPPQLFLTDASGTVNLTDSSGIPLHPQADGIQEGGGSEGGDPPI